MATIDLVKNIEKLLGLDLGDRVKTKSINGKREIEHLDLSLLNLTNISEELAEIIRSCTHLKFLSISQNSISSIPESIFDQLHDLQRLFLYENQLKEIDSSLFHPLVNLVDLYINSNQISTLHSDQFSTLHFLRTLSLYHNPVSYLPQSIFKSVLNLASLDLAYLPIKQLPMSIGGLNKLKSLNLEHTALNEQIAKKWASHGSNKQLTNFLEPYANKWQIILKSGEDPEKYAISVDEGIDELIDSFDTSKKV